MTTEDVPIYKRWRENLERWMRQGEALEAIASLHPEIPFTVEPFAKTLQWCEFYEDIQGFSVRVKKVAAIFGTPTVVRTIPKTSDQLHPPDLEAQWKEGDVTIEVKAFWPACRIHPESKYMPAQHTEAQHPEIHPECADALKELEDCGLETALTGANDAR